MRGKRALAGILMAAIIITNIDVVRAEDVAVPQMEEQAASTGEETKTSKDGKYEYVLMGDEEKNVAKLTKYLGNETNLTIPAMIDIYEVKELAYLLLGTGNTTVTNIIVEEGIVNIGQAFCGCTNLEQIQFPSTVKAIANECFNGSIKLKEIDVTQGGEVYFSRNGVLYFYSDNRIYLQSYPAGRDGDSFTVPADVYGLGYMSFVYTQKLEKLIIPSTIRKTLLSMMYMPEQPINIYINHTDFNELSLASQTFYHLPSGSKIYVKNSTVASQIRSYIEESSGIETEVINLAENTSAQIHAESLTFTDEQPSQNKMMSVGDRYSLAGQYIIKPSDTTDNVTWSSSDEKIATVNATTGMVEALKTGECQIVGQDESNHKITVELTVYQGITNVDLFYEVLNPEEKTIVYGDSSYVTNISVRITPYNSNNRDNVLWRSSEPSVATVESRSCTQSSDDYYRNSATLTIKSPGTTTITATITDNDNIITKSFVLNVTKPIVGINTCNVAAIPTQTYTGFALAPVLTVKNGSTILKEGTDYTLEYKNNINSGTATVVITGIGEYTGTKNITFEIAPKSIAASTVSGIANKTYTGKAITQSVMVKDGTSILKLGTDYKLTYKNNVNVGTSTVTITGIGNYQGTISKTFKITKASQTIKTTSSYKKAYGSKPFTVSAKRTKGNGSLSYKSSDKKVVTVSSKGKVTIQGTGVATITVTAKATSSYNAKSTKVTISVVPKKETITYYKSTAKKKLTVKWKKDTKATGYQIQYSTSKKFTSKTTKSVTISKNKTTSTTIKRLKSKKMYYIRVRAYKTVKVNGKTTKFYGNYSKAKKYMVR